MYLIHQVIISAFPCLFVLLFHTAIACRKRCHSNIYQHFLMCRCWPWLQLLMTLIILRKLRLITLWTHHMFSRHAGRSVHLLKFISCLAIMYSCSICIFRYFYYSLLVWCFLSGKSFFFLVNQLRFCSLMVRLWSRFYKKELKRRSKSCMALGGMSYWR